MTILVLTADPLPLPGLPATGAGLRAWGLAEGLKSAGVNARALMPASLLAGRADPDSPLYSQHVFPDAALNDFIRAANPEALVLQHWGMMARIGEVNCPVAIDLAGPHLLERRHWGHENLVPDWQEKLAALRRADFVVCSGRDQRLYFLPWLMLAGFDPADPALCPPIPFSWSSEEPPARKHLPGEADEITFLAGGVLLPWQNPLPTIEILLEEMDRIGTGRLTYCGGPHPAMNVAGGESVALLERLQQHPRVALKPLMSFEEWLDEIGRSDVAFDLLPRNNEREIAFPTRTSIYLWSGLPTLHADYDELGRWIATSAAGWAIDPQDEKRLREVIGQILRRELSLKEAGENARALGRIHLNWARTITPLAEFCRVPYRRKSTTAQTDAQGESADSPRLLALRRDLALAQSEIDALKGKWPFRLAKKLKKLTWLTAPVVYPLVFLISAGVAVAAKLSDAANHPRQL